MKKINDIFYSLQGEGHNTGRAAVFIRFAGCNLRCPFCDTEFDSYREMTDADIVKAIGHYGSRFVVLTGGEPTLQADEAFVELLHSHGYEVAMESNGTRPAPKNLDWLTVSPKSPSGGRMELRGERMPDEIKIVFGEDTHPEEMLAALMSALQKHAVSPQKYLQPCDTGNEQQNARITARCVDYILKHPEWRLSLQTHKLINIK